MAPTLTPNYAASGSVGAETARAEAAEALLAPLASPALTGNPTVPTQAPLTNNTRAASTAYTDAAVSVEKSRAQTAEGLLAPLASASLTGAPTAPTQAALDNSTKLSTTAYTDGAVAVETTRATTAEATKAPLASPALSGTPTAPTPAADNSSTQVATTAFVIGQGSTAAPIIDGTATAGSSTRWAHGDHVHPTDTSRAPLASPALTGTPTAPTATPLTNSTQLATSAYSDLAVGVEKTRALAAEALLAPISTTVADSSGNGTVDWSTLKGTVINVKWAAYGAKGDGTTDDTTAIQTALTQANTNGGAIVIFPPGTYIVSSTLTVYSNTWIMGSGELVTTIKLANSSNVDLVNSYQFSTLTGTNSTSGVHHVGIEKIGFDGNRANNTSGNGVRLYGYSFRLRDYRVQSAVGVGVWTEWGNGTISGSTTDQLIMRMDGFSIHDCGSWGLQVQGPHDSVVQNGEVYRNAQILANKGNIFTTGYGAGIHFKMVHAYGATTGNNTSWGITTTCFLVDCVGEGGSGANLYLNGTGANSTSIIGGQWFTGSSPTDLIGIKIDGAVANYLIITSTSAVSNGAIWFNNDGGNGLVILSHTGGTKILKGTPSASTTCLVQGPSSGTYDAPAQVWAAQGYRAHVRDNNQSGMLTGQLGSGMGAANIVANKAYFVRFVPSRNMTITKMAIPVATAASVNDNSDVGIFDTTGTLLASAGSTAGKMNATGAATWTLSSSVTLAAGTTYYAAFAYGTIGGTAANLGGFNGSSGMATIFGSTVPAIEWFSIGSLFPLATIAGFTGLGAQGAVPVFAIRES